MLAEAGQRPLALERQRRPGLVQRGAVLAEHRDVLAQPVGAGADEPHVRRDALELVGEDGVQALVLARLDDEREPREPRPQRLAFRSGAPRVHRHHCLTHPRSALTGWGAHLTPHLGITRPSERIALARRRSVTGAREEIRDRREGLQSCADGCVDPLPRDGR